MQINKKLDYCEDEILQVSNDAYYNLAFKEPCLDEENQDEVNEIKARFPYGFKICPDIEFVENSDLVEIKLIPINECNNKFTHFRIDGKWHKHEFYYSEDRKQVYYRIYDMYYGRFIDYGWCDISINSFKKPEVKVRGCTFPIWGQKWTLY